MSRIGMYDHLGVKFDLNLDSLANQIVDQNYGAHQMLSALVRAHKRKYPKRTRENSNFNILLEIEYLLDKGCF